MKILLPPSEGKAAPQPETGQSASGSGLDLDALLLPELAADRERVLSALIAASGCEDAQTVLKVGAQVVAEVRANLELREALTAPAYEVYTGVLFDALQAHSLSPEQRGRAAQDVLIFSGLFGVTGFTDRIPAYRLSMDVKLAELGNLGTYWKGRLRDPLQELVGDELVIDCRSATYGRAFQPSPQRTLMVNSFTEKDGARKVVTHFAKQARGELTGMLLRAQEPVETIDDVAAVASQRWTVEIRPAAGRSPHQLDLISTAA
ncbi:YaaA family protein [Nesterenkonia lacusekhoensis]|uniref:Cytoplasmic iron level regulating protein YaaA (DUF328/UPF0246 family) n=1 Tax=Nesterenkonia lacusekhoensis TaxID=150832 RepID=A0ABS4T0N9_9MICC|nr:cytoplasmic iron level regulating protein YaaA (DUF328/UPF0246 family) [Nesterenkonia lacusekhoensis]